MVTQHKEMLVKLKKQVKVLQLKEKKMRSRLQQALREVKQIARTYKKDLMQKTRDAEVTAYSKLAKTIHQKAKKLKSKRKPSQ